MAKALNMTHTPVFEALGESQVRMQFASASGKVGVQAREWLKLRELAREEEATAKRDAREEETLSIARQARSDARLANRIAITAAIFATLATIIAAAIAVMTQHHHSIWRQLPWHFLLS